MTYKEEKGKVIVTNTTIVNDSHIVTVDEDFDYILNKEQKDVSNKEKGILPSESSAPAPASTTTSNDKT